MEPFIILWYGAILVLAIVGTKTLVEGFRKQDGKKKRDALLLLVLPLIALIAFLYPLVVVLFIGDLM